MATERLEPDVLIANSGWSGTPVVGDIQDDPDTKTWPAADPLRAANNNTSTSIHCSFPSPTGNLTVGADLQEFRVLLRPFDSGQTGHPDWRIELWQNNVLVRAGTDTQILTDAGDTVVAFTWNANELTTDPGGVQVEIKVFGTKTGGSPGTRNTVDIGAVEWNVDYTAVSNDIAATLAGVLTLAADLDATGKLESTLAGVLTVAADLDATGKLEAALISVFNVAADLDATGALAAAINQALVVTPDLDATGTLATAVNQALSVTAGIDGGAAPAGALYFPIEAPWTTQPPRRVTINKSNPIAAKLGFLWIGPQTNQPYGVDLVSGVVPVLAPSGDSPVSGFAIPGGVVSQINDGGFVQSLGFFNLSILGEDGLSSFVVMRSRDPSITDFSAVVAAYDGTGAAESDMVFVQYPFTSTNNRAAMYSGTDGSDWQWNGSNDWFNDELWHSFGFSKTWGSSTAQGFFDGALIESDNGSLPLTQITINEITLLSNVTWPVEGFGGDLLYAAIFKETLTDVEAKSLHENPWQLLTPEEHWYKIGAAAEELYFPISAPVRRSQLAVRVDSSGDALTLTDFPGITSGSYAGWFRRLSLQTGVDRYCIGASNSVASSFIAIGWSPDDEFGLVTDSGVQLFTTEPGVGEWHFIAITVAGSGANQAKAYFYDQAGLVESVTTTGPSSGADEFGIMTSRFGAWLDGAGADFGVWNKPLNDIEVERVYRAGPRAVLDGLYRHFRFDGTTFDSLTNVNVDAATNIDFSPGPLLMRPEEHWYKISAAVGEDENLAAALAGVLSIAADLDAVGGLETTLTSVLSVAADLDATGKLEAALTSALSVVADLDAAGELDAAFTSALTIAADLDATGKLEAALIGALIVAADLDATGKLETTLISALSVAADLDATGKLEATLIGALTIAADLDATGKLEATLISALIVAADLDATGKLETTLTSVLNVAANIAGATLSDLSAVLANTFVVVADLNAIGELTSAQVAALTVAADLSAQGRLEASVILALTVAADLDAAGKLETATAIQLNVVADLDAAGELSTNISTLFSIAADLSAAGSLQTSIAATLTVIANIESDVNEDITAVLANTFTVVADLNAIGELTSAQVAALTLAVDLSAQGKLEAAVTLALLIAADLDAAGKLEAATTIQLTVAADLDAAGGLSAGPAMLVTVAADLDAAGSLEVAIASISSLSAVLVDGNAAAIPPFPTKRHIAPFWN